MNYKVTESVLKKITNQQVMQKPAWYFWAQTILFVIGGLVFFLIGTLASASLFLLIEELPFAAIWKSRTLLKLILFGFPLFWVFIAIALGSLAVFMSRQTEGAYKYKWQWVLLSAIVLQTVIGFSLSHSNTGERIEDFISQSLRQEQRMQDWRQAAWRNPEAGLMVGRVIEYDSPIIVVQPPYGNAWSIDTSKAKPFPSDRIKVGMFIRAHGNIRSKELSPDGESVFIADRVIVGRPLRHERKTNQSKREKPRNRKAF